MRAVTNRIATHLCAETAVTGSTLGALTEVTVVTVSRSKFIHAE